MNKDIVEEEEVPIEESFDKDEFIQLPPEEESKPKSMIIKLSDISKCPKKSLSPQHYYLNGRCKCNEKKDIKASKTS